MSNPQAKRYNVIDEADAFRLEWDAEEWDIDRMIAREYTIDPTGGTNPMPMDAAIGYCVGQYKQALTNMEIYSQMERFATAAGSIERFTALKMAAGMLINVKSQMESIKALKRVKSPQKIIKELQEQLMKEQSLRKEAEERANIAEKAVSAKEGIIDHANQELRKYSEQNEMFVIYGRTLTPKFVQEAEGYYRKRHESSMSSSNGDAHDE